MQRYLLSTMLLAAAFSLAVVCCAPAAQAADEVPEQRLVDQSPFDEVVLKGSGKGKKLRVLPLKLEDRRVPSPFPGGRLLVRLVSKPGVDYEVSWDQIATIRLYEQMVVTEADRLVKSKKFNEAFDYFALLHTNYSHMPGLETRTSRYLQANALDAFRNKQYDHALAILQSLYERNRAATGIGRAVDTVVENILREHQEAGNWQAARSVLDVVEQQFKGAQLKVVGKWRATLKTEAEKKLREGAVALRNGQYRTARAAAIDAAGILPSHPLAKELERRVAAKYPTIVVGVRTRLAKDVPPRIDLPESLRTGQLTRRTITELTGYSPEGGVYTCPVGRVGLDDTGSKLSFGFPAEQGGLTAFKLARWLLRAADPSRPEYVRGFASVTESIATESAGELTVQLSRPHIRPEGLLRFSPLVDIGVSLKEAFDVQEHTSEESVLVARAPGAPVAEVVERFYSADNDALKALARGDIDVVDRLMPWQVSAVKRNKTLAVGEYELPTVHVLLLNPKSKLLDRRPMRRALLYGLNRQQVMDELILGGRKEAGFELVSGPFPRGKSFNDPVHYGYHDGVEPRRYDPRLAKILSALAWTQVQRAEHGKEDEADRPFPTLRIAHGTDPIARGACQSIQMQLKAAGIPIETVELSGEQLASGEGEFDIRYAEMCVWEPLVDAETILGPSGIAGRCSDPMVAALQKLDVAKNWGEVGASLRNIHELAASELPLIPLWQTSSYYAYRRNLVGVPESTVTLYQSILGWRRQ